MDKEYKILVCNDCKLECKEENYINKYKLCDECYKKSLQLKINNCVDKYHKLSLQIQKIKKEMNYQGAKQEHLIKKLELLSK